VDRLISGLVIGFVMGFFFKPAVILWFALGVGFTYAFYKLNNKFKF
jgi:hypothetical protein